MASAEGKARYTASYFTKDFQISLSSPDHPSSVSKKLVSDWLPSNNINDPIHANSVFAPNNLNSDKLPEMKWWLHVKSDLGDEANYTCQHLNSSCESEFGASYAEFLNCSVKSGEDQLVKDFDVLSNIDDSANLSVEQPWHVSPTCMKNNNTRIAKIEASLNTDLHFTPRKKDQELCFSDSHFMDCDISNFLVSEQGKVTSSDLESHLVGDDKTGPWWRTAGKDELASLVARKSLEHIENCDLPYPQTKNVSQRRPYPKGVDHDRTPPSFFNHKFETGSSNASGYTTGISTSNCSFQDSNKHSSSSQSTDSSSSNKVCQINSENSSVSELLKALCHSQTRAREAEKAAKRAYSEKEHILSLFYRQASQLFAYKKWLHMLQLENLCLQLRNKNQSLLNLFPASLPWAPCKGMLLKKSHSSAVKKKNSDRRCGIKKCVVAFAVGIGLAGAGLLLGWTMGWMFPPL